MWVRGHARVCGSVRLSLKLVQFSSSKDQDVLQRSLNCSHYSVTMVSFESLGTVSYSHSIITITVSLTILDIFGVKEWSELEHSCSNTLEHSSLRLGLGSFIQGH